MESRYIHDEIVHNYKAAQEVLPYVQKLFQPKSIVDVGCGIGTWLKVAKELGVKDVLGADGDYVNKGLLKIDRTEFTELDLVHPFNLNRKYDLAICLEVAEHLPVTSAKSLISSLCLHSDKILFSAAVPNQGGQNHLNEQWPQYWVDLFYENGFEADDSFRLKFWNNEKVEYWYKQNFILFEKKDSECIKKEVLSLIHPELLHDYVSDINYLQERIEHLNVVVENLGDANYKLQLELNKTYGIRGAVKNLIHMLKSKWQKSSTANKAAVTDEIRQKTS